MPFLRYGDLLTENCELFLPQSQLRHGVNPFQFLDEFFKAKTKVRALFVCEDLDFVILARVVLTQCQRVTDRQMEGTDGRTDGQTDRRTTRPWLSWIE